MAHFFPALAHTDTMGFFDENNHRRLMSVRALLPESIAANFLISLSFDESIHYAPEIDLGDSNVSFRPTMPEIKTVFVDCGAFHYVGEDSPKFKKGGYVTSKTAFDEYMQRHVEKNPNINYLLCSPDHIISPESSDDEFEKRRGFILQSAKGFLKRVEGVQNVTPIGVVHGRNSDERADIAKELINLGYDYIAFGGLVPLARNTLEVLTQIGGISDLNNPTIDPESAFGLCLANGCNTHIFGLNSPEWYRWWKRIGITSFDGSKLSQEGAANGIIWKESFDNPKPTSGMDLYERLQIKNIEFREWIQSGNMHILKTSDDGFLDFNNFAWDYLMAARCTSERCPQSHVKHNCDPRVTGSIEHNMGRMVLNSHTFDAIMRRIDQLCDRANSRPPNSKEKWLDQWKQIEVGK